MNKANGANFGAVLLPDGALNADNLRVGKDSKVRTGDGPRSKAHAFICHPPWLLVSAGLTKGRTVTSYHTIQNELRKRRRKVGGQGSRPRRQLGEQPSA